MDLAESPSRPPAAQGKLRKRISAVFTKKKGSELGSELVAHKLDSVDTLCAQTKFTKRELRLLYRNFKEDCPNGIVTQRHFLEVFAKLFPDGDPSAYAKLVFDSIDADDDGRVHFGELVRHLSALSRGSTEEKANWIFDLYDTAAKGEITFSDIHTIAVIVHNSSSNFGHGKKDEAQAAAVLRAHAERVFKDMDPEGKGYVTGEQFSRWCIKNSDRRNSLAVFDTVL